MAKTEDRIVNKRASVLDRFPWHFPVSHFVIGFLAVALIFWLIFGMAPLRYQMLLADPYGFANGLRALGIPLSSFALYFTALELIPAIVFLTVAAFIVWQRFENRFARLVSASFALNALLFPLADGFIFAYPEWTLVLSALRVSTVVGIVAVQCMFPNGRFVPKWTFWLWLCWSIGWSVSLFLNPAVLADLALLATIQTMDESQGILLGMGGVVIAIIGQIVRYHQYATDLEKQQVKWLLFGFVITILIALFSVLLLIAFPTINDPSRNGLLFIMIMGGAMLLSFSCIPVAIAVSILRYRLWNIDFYLNRTLVYGALTTMVLGIYALLISGTGILFHSRNNLVASLLATGIIAVIFQPARAWLQSLANRWLFGERDDPAGVLTRLTSQLERANSGDSLLDMMVATIASSLKLPYVALWLDGKTGQRSMVAEAGTRPKQVETIPLLHQQERVGHLDVAPRSPGEALSQADQQLLAAIARLTATTARTIQLTDEVQEARVRTVSAREEERRRLRRDLHDGLGPVLAGQGLKLAAARQLLRDKPEVAERLLDEVMSQSENTVAEVRRLVYALRPPTLDELGLVGAIREHVETVGVGLGVQITVDAPAELPPIPAAIEVAAFRIVQEALNNVLRHANAGHCVITVQFDTMLTILVEDNGTGFTTQAQSGVGLQSMHERAVEVGGTCTVENRQFQGVTVRLMLPLASE